MLKDLVQRGRTRRRFYEDERVSIEPLRSLIELARLCPSSANLQPLKYMIVAERKHCDALFPNLAWAGYLKDWGGPKEGERPSAYIIILGDTEVSRNFSIDLGIAAQTIALGAVELGLGACMVASVNRSAIRGSFNIPERFEVALVLALGKPKETVVLEEVGPDGDVKYWRDKDGAHHVPKRRIEDILLEPVIE